MKEKTRNIISNLFQALLFIVVAYLLILSGENRDKGSYNYCVEWGGFIDRDELVFECYNFVKQQVKCNYEIDDVTQMLAVFPYKQNGTGQLYNCSRFVKSVMVE